MNAVGIDASKGKSMVAALRPMGEVALPPQEFLHTASGLDQMAHAILALGEDTRVIMEATGRYHEPVAAALSAYGIYVCVLNPLYIKQSGAGSIRKVKTDKADAMKIAKYGLDNWVDLREHTPMDTIRQQLKLPSMNKGTHASQSAFWTIFALSSLDVPLGTPAVVCLKIASNCALRSLRVEARCICCYARLSSEGVPEGTSSESNTAERQMQQHPPYVPLSIEGIQPPVQYLHENRGIPAKQSYLPDRQNISRHK